MALACLKDLAGQRRLLVREDVTAEQIQDIHRRIEEMIREAGPEVQPTPASSS
jgi:hypothetical protein